MKHNPFEVEKKNLQGQFLLGATKFVFEKKSWQRMADQAPITFSYYSCHIDQIR
jgi:hypothetical protein